MEAAARNSTFDRSPFGVDLAKRIYLHGFLSSGIGKALPNVEGFNVDRLLDGKRCDPCKNLRGSFEVCELFPQGDPVPVGNLGYLQHFDLHLAWRWGMGWAPPP